MDTWQNHQKIRWLLSFKGVNVIVRSNAMLVHVTKVFFKVSLWWPQGNFKRPLGGIWETVLHWYDLRSLYFERPLEEFERPFWSHTLKKTLPLTICRLRYVTVCRTIRIVPALEGAHRRFAEDAGIAVLQAAWEAEGDWRELSICMPNQ